MSISDYATSVSNQHPDYRNFTKSWKKIRDCLKGEDKIKSETEKYLPRPAGMSGEYAAAYDAYIERAHFPLIVSYALSGALGLVVTKLPEFHVPPQLDYLLKTATKDGKSMNQFFLDVIIEIFQTGRVPILIDYLPKINQFRFVQYSAEEFINWKIGNDEKSGEQKLKLGVIQEKVTDSDNIFSHDTDDEYRVLYINEEGKYITQKFKEGYNKNSKELTIDEGISVLPTVYGKSMDKIPLVIAGSIDNDFNVQPIPLVSVANCSVQIYRKEADLANSEFLSCNPTLVIVGASNDDDLPNVVGSSVMMVIPNEAARVFYTTTDTAALTHVKDHIKDLYEEAIRHGVAILDARKGVEAAEALRIRQATQSATIFSIYMSAVNAIKTCMEYMCEWSGIPLEQVQIDAPNSLNTGFPDAGVLKSILLGVEDSAVPLQTLYRYLLDASLLEQSVSYEEYLEMINSEEMKTVLENVKKGGMVDNLGANMFESKVRQEMKTGNELKDKASSKTEIEEA
jgi:hypothetical protein